MSGWNLMSTIQENNPGKIKLFTARGKRMAENVGAFSIVSGYNNCFRCKAGSGQKYRCTDFCY